MIKHRFNWPVRVYYEDTDAGGVVFYANYLKFFERARTEMLRAIGFEQDVLMSDVGIVFVVRTVHIEYLQPARFNQLLQVSAELSELRKVSLTFEQEITHNNVLLCKSTIKIVCLNVHTMRPKAIPENLFEHFKKYEH